VKWPAETRLNGGNRLVSTYGAKPAVLPAGEPDGRDGDRAAGLMVASQQSPVTVTRPASSVEETSHRQDAVLPAW
jgi:hypothetical protein